MVIKSNLRPSRAGSLDLIGGELALDFTNTSSGRGWPTHEEHLRTAENVVAWAGHAKILGPADAAWMSTAVGADPGLAAQLLQRALALRETLYVIGGELAQGRPAPPPRVAELAREHARCIAQAALAPHEGRYVWQWTPKQAAIEALLGPIALSALTMLAQADLSRVKRCRGEKCGWLFFDATKNKSRRWCEMEVCGNRAKQKRHAGKARGQG